MKGLQKYDYGYGQINPETGVIAANSNNGQLAKIESTIGTAKQWEQRFGYDSIGRLSEAREHRGDTNALSYKQKFDYDRFGNLYRKASSNPTTGQATPIAFAPLEDSDIGKTTNRFTSGTTYDNAGNVTQDTKYRNLNYFYDANGRMYRTSVINQPNQSNVVYDASGNRVATQVDGVWTFFIFDAFGKKVAEYGGLQATDEGGVKYVLQDYQGSSRAIVSNSGYINARMDYTAFGEEIQTNIGQRTAQGYGTSNTLNQKYALTERDKATGLDHTWFRKLENQAGRWTSPDPYNGSMRIGNPQSFNRFAYVNNQPTNYIDPSGLDWIPYRCFCVDASGGGWTDPNPQCDTCWAWVPFDSGHSSPFDGILNPPDLGGPLGTHPGDPAPTPPPANNCGVNPVTGMPGINTHPGANPWGGRPGGLGNIRPGVGGRGGFRERDGAHDATDIVAPVGTPIVANRGGTVVATQTGHNGGYGNTVIIQHSGGIYTMYNHLTSISVGLGPVGQGQVLGTAGRTGNIPSNQLASEDHLHFAVFTGPPRPGVVYPKSGSSQFRDPATYLNSPCL